MLNVNRTMESNSIEIKQVNSDSELKKFVKFPFSLYKNNPYWTPPIIQEEIDVLDTSKNPVFENAEADYYLAYKNGEIVGRIAVIINWTEVNQLERKKVRFGWFDVVDDINNLTTFDLYLIQRNPLIYFRMNWFNIVSLVLLLAIFYKVSIKK